MGVPSTAEVAVSDASAGLGSGIVVEGAAGPTPVHATWHALRLVVGPFHLTAELPTLPGYDPGRSLTRPGFAFWGSC